MILATNSIQLRRSRLLARVRERSSDHFPTFHSKPDLASCPLGDSPRSLLFLDQQPLRAITHPIFRFSDLASEIGRRHTHFRDLSPNMGPRYQLFTIDSSYRNCAFFSAPFSFLQYGGFSFPFESQLARQRRDIPQSAALTGFRLLREPTR
jgi:hypothetical protein